MEKRQPLQQMLQGKVVIHVQLKLYSYVSPCTSINSKLIKDLNIRPETLKLLQEGAGKTLEVIHTSKDFLNRNPAAQQLRKNGQMGLHEIKNFLHNRRNGL
jgi:hypothetical protein